MGVNSKRSYRTIRLQLLQCFDWGIDLDYHDIEWFALEMNRDHSVVFEIASKYCISDSFVDYHRKITNLITWTTALSNSMKLSHALWGHPRWVGHGGEV